MSPSTPASFEGTERFKIRRRIGAGGMGVVYEAVDRDRDERVALKTLREVSATGIYRLKEEFRALADLAHPNLVRLYELVSVDDRWFYTMELVEGVHLLDFVRFGVSKISASSVLETTIHTSASDSRSTERFPATPGSSLAADAAVDGTPVSSVGTSPAQLMRLRRGLRQLCEGVMALHEAGKVHRDIKPSNVLVTRAERVVLLDLGLAFDIRRRTARITRDSQVVGTVGYMAPEQGVADRPTPASDWYSVGVILYEALTGRQPFVGTSVQVLMDKQQFEPPAPRELAADIPEDLNWLCTQLLRRDPGARPSGSEVLRRLGSRAVEPRTLPLTESSAVSRIPFVGRQAYLRSLAEALAEVRGGRTVVINIRGCSGVGKSALLGRFLEAEEVKRSDVVALAGRCYERESVPFKAVDSLVDELAVFLVRLSRSSVEALMPRDALALARLFPVLRCVEAIAAAPLRRVDVPNQQELRSRAFRALRELLSRLGDRMTLLLTIDDMQWADFDSIVLLNELLRPPDPPVMLLITSSRSEDEAASPVLQAFGPAQRAQEDEIDVRQVTVEPLTKEEAQQLAVALLDDDSPDTLELAHKIAEECGGNPYFVDALVRQRQVDAAGPGDAERSGAISLDEVLWSHARRLPQPALRLLQIVSVNGQPLRQGEAFAGAELSASTGRSALNILRTARLVRTTGKHRDDLVETYHDRVRETVVTRLSPGDLRNRHLRLALALEASGSADPALLAGHFHASGHHERAGEYYAMAASQATEALAFDRAAQLYQLALEVNPGNAAEQRGLRTLLGDALANAGRGRQAAEQYLLAATGAAAGEALELRRQAAVQSLISGHIDEGLVALRQVLTGVGMKLPSTSRRAFLSLLWQRARLRLRGLRFKSLDPSQVSHETLARVDVSWAASTGLSMVDPIRGADFQARDLLLALRTGEPYRVARALAMEAAHVAVVGGPARGRAERLLEQADDLARQVEVPHAIGLVSMIRGVAAFLQGRWKLAVEHCDRADRILRDQCTGVAWELDTGHTFSLWALFYMGEAAELARRLPMLAAEARDRGNLYALANLGSFAAPLARLAADDPDAAELGLREVMCQWSREGFHVQHLNGLYGQVQIDIYRGRGQAAWEVIDSQWPTLKRSLLLRIQQVRVVISHIYARAALAFAVDAHRPDEMLRFAVKIARKLDREKGVAWPKPLANLLRAGVAAFGRDDAKALEMLQQAIQQFDAVDMGLYAASSRRRLGELLGGDEGRRWVEEADRWMVRQQVQNPARMAAMHAPGFPG